MLPFDDKQRQVLDDIFREAYDRLVEAAKSDDVKDHDAIVTAVLAFAERVIPQILNLYKGEEYEKKCKAIACSFRITISAIMPIEKFLKFMEGDEMKIIDKIVKDFEENGEGEIKPEELKLLFEKETKAKDNIYQ